MSIKVMSLVWDTDLSATDKLVLLKLADCGNDQGESIYPSVSTIARQCSMDERSIRRILKRLRERKLIKIVKHANKKQKTNKYVIDIKEICKNTPDTVPPLTSSQGPPDPVSSPPLTSGQPNRNIEPLIKREKEYIDEIKDIYNNILGDILPSCRSVSKSRRVTMRNMFASEFNKDINEWKEYCHRVRRCPFLIGDNNRGWTASFDWLIKPMNINKVKEGTYDARVSKAQPKTGVDAMFNGFESAVDKY